MHGNSHCNPTDRVEPWHQAARNERTSFTIASILTPDA